MKISAFCMAAIVSLGLIAFGSLSPPVSDQMAFAYDAIGSPDVAPAAQPVEIKCLAPDVDALAMPFAGIEKRSQNFNQKSEKLHIGFSTVGQEVGVFLDTDT